MRFSIVKFNQMNLIELFKELRDLGFSDPQIAEKSGLSQPTITRLRKKKDGFNKIYPSTLKSLADAFGYDLKYEHGEPQFYPRRKDDASISIRGDPAAQKADAIYRYLREEVGIEDVEELKKLFYDFGAVLGAKHSEIKSLLAKIRALDIVRGFIKKEVK